jgi:DNA-binding response OmpR family regulator/predicted amidohydrolase
MEEESVQRAAQRQRILIVEDEARAAHAVQDALALEDDRQWEVHIARSGEEALALLASQPVDLVLLDMRLPGISGAEVLRRLRAAPETRHIPVIFLSGATSFDLSLEGIQEGVLLRKPFQIPDLLAMVNANLPTSSTAPDAARPTRQQEGAEIITPPARSGARFLAVSNRLNIQAAASEATFIAELERVVGLAVPHLAADRPNLVVLGALLGLPLAVSGRRGWLSRHMRSSTPAIGALALAWLPRLLYYRRRYPGISLVRALVLSLADTLYRPFVTTLSRLARQHQIILAASTAVPRVRRSSDPAEIRHFGGEGARAAGEVWLPTSSEVYHTGFLWGPDGALLGTAENVFLSVKQKPLLDVSPGRLEDARAFETPAGRVGLAISLDAFTPAYLEQLDALGVEIIIQHAANASIWAGPGKTGEWHPQEWLNAVMGSMQAQYPHLRYHLCAMQTGNFFESSFDGQSSIIRKSDQPPDPANTFVGNEGFSHTVTGQRFTAEVLAVAPWVEDDPILSQPDLTLAERRARLASTGRQLRPGGARANQFRESVIWADRA